MPRGRMIVVVCGKPKPTRCQHLNLLTYTFPRPATAARSSDPSTAIARLQVIGTRCRLAGPQPAPSPHSDRPGFDQLGRSALVCRLTAAGALLLHEPTEANLGFRYVCQHDAQLSWTCPTHVCMRPEAPSHASAKPFLSCTLPVTMRSPMGAPVAAGRSATPRAPIGPCSSHRGG